MVYYNKKERLIFWLGLLTGIVGGAVGNFWVSSYYKLTENYRDPVNWAGFVIFSALFIIIVVFVKSRLDATLAIRPGRPKKKMYSK